MIIKTIVIDGKPVEFRASATVPRLYRFKFGRDIITDMQSVCDAYSDNQESGKPIPASCLDIFENVAYIMAKHAAPDEVPKEPDKWLENFSMFSIYEILPELLALWGMNIETTVESKKKLSETVGR